MEEHKAESSCSAHEICEKWRLRGNQAYADRNFTEAEDHYTRGMNSVPREETSESSLAVLTLCYSNRAAVRMSGGRMRAALHDCKKAIEITPDFHKAKVRAGKCHLALGEAEDALKYFESSLPQEAALCLDRKLALEASDGLRKAKQISDCFDHCVELLRSRTSNNAKRALQIIDGSLLISPYSERLLEMKAEALLLLLKHEEMIQLCEQSLDSADKSSHSPRDDVSESKSNSSARLWRWQLMAKSYFYQGTLEESLNLFEKLEQQESSAQKFGRQTPEPWNTLAITVRELLHHKAAGIEAFQTRRYLEAVEHYTSALTCNLESLPFVAICYYNRGAAHQALGEVRAALEDYKRAAEINPDSRKVQVRVANCHLELGEIDEALQYFENSLPQEVDVCLDRELVIEASNGQQKALKVRGYLNRSGELLRLRTSSDLESALQIIAKALLISPYSDKLIEMKAEALFLLLMYEEVIQLCEQTLDAADRNSSSVKANGPVNIQNHPARLWRWHLMAKSYFYLGRLPEALSSFEKLKQAQSNTQKYGSNNSGSTHTLAVTVRELLRHKDAGLEAFHLGRHSRAVEHYTSALSRSLESRPFSATCFYNRAASHQALGQITDAIADCSFAVALVENYPKAISRRAALHEMIGDYSKAVTDLQRLISEETSNQSGKLTKSTCGSIDLRQVQLRLSKVEEKAKSGTPLDLYLILGVKSSCGAADIKKAYRKAALRHNPDKASLVLPKSENGHDGVWKDIAEIVHKDADVLFKTIGQAYAVLSDPVQRSRYDEDASSGN